MVASSSTWVAAAENAPMAINPSRAMFTTPERSQIMPPAAVIRMGDTIINTDGIIPRILVILSLLLFLPLLTDRSLFGGPLHPPLQEEPDARPDGDEHHNQSLDDEGYLLGNLL